MAEMVNRDFVSEEGRGALIENLQIIGQDETQGAVLGAVSAEAMLLMPLEDRMEWFLNMFDTDVAEEVTVEDIWAGTATGYVSPAVLAAAQEYQTRAASAGVVTIDGETGFNFEVTLGANVTGVTPSNLLPGVPYVVRFVQGGAGDFTIAFGGSFSRQVGLPESFASATGTVSYVILSNTGTVGSPVYEVAAGASDA